MQRNLPDFLIGHCVVFQRELAVRKHKLRVVLLRTFDPPWGIDQDNFELANFLNEQLPVEVLHIAVDEGVDVDGGLIIGFVESLLSFVKHLYCAKVFVAVVAKVLVNEWKFEGRGVFTVALFIFVVFFLFGPFFGVFPLKFTFRAGILNLWLFVGVGLNKGPVFISGSSARPLAILFANLFMLDLVVRSNFIA